MILSSRTLSLHRQNRRAITCSFSANGQAAAKLRPAQLYGHPGIIRRLGLLRMLNIETAAQRDGVCITTLRRAKFDLGVLITKESVPGFWYWELPQTAGR
jgi:hypothetical protein